MTLLHLVVLALIQGITEFLPISSSAHLVLLPSLTGWPDQGLDMDIAVHVGTLLAVLVYFRGDVIDMIGGFLRLLTGRRSEGGMLALKIVVASLPIIVVGVVISHWLLGDGGRDLRMLTWIIAGTSIGYGILLWLIDTYAPGEGTVEEMGWGATLVIGIAQALALVPGTSRSGATMTAGRLVGLSRRESARFSMLMAIPAILGAAVFAVHDIVEAGNVTLGQDALIGIVLSFLSAWAVIALLMRWVERMGFLPFVIYRVLLGCGLIAWLLMTA